MNVTTIGASKCICSGWQIRKKVSFKKSEQSLIYHLITEVKLDPRVYSVFKVKRFFVSSLNFRSKGKNILHPLKLSTERCT